MVLSTSGDQQYSIKLCKCYSPDLAVYFNDEQSKQARLSSDGL